jgi:hypothetical protein
MDPTDLLRRAHPSLLPIPLPLLLAALVSLSLPPTVLHAQRTTVTSQGQSSSTSQDPEADPEIVFAFRGGPIEAFVAEWRAFLGDEAPNILVRDSALGLPVPAFSLRACGSSMIALRTVSELVEWKMELETPGPILESASDVLVVGVRASRSTPERQRVLTASLRELVRFEEGAPASLSIPAETVLTAIQTALELETVEGDEPVMRYHEESQLLFVRGRPDLLQTVEGVRVTLLGDLEQARRNWQQARTIEQRAAQSAAKLAEAEEKAAFGAERTADLRIELEAAHFRTKAAEVEAEAMRDQLRKFQMVVASREVEVQKLQELVARLEAELQAARKGKEH